MLFMKQKTMVEIKFLSICNSDIKEKKIIIFNGYLIIIE